MLTRDTKQYGFLVLATAAGSVALAGALSCSGSALAQEPQKAPSWPAVQLVGERLADLEEAFWSCDYVATTRGVASADVVTCGAIYYVLKERKFDGDLDKLVSWWRQNKIAQHEKLALVGQP